MEDWSVRDPLIKQYHVKHLYLVQVSSNTLVNRASVTRSYLTGAVPKYVTVFDKTNHNQQKSLLLVFGIVQQPILCSA